MAFYKWQTNQLLRGVGNFALRPIAFAGGLIGLAVTLLFPILFLRGITWGFEHVGQWLLVAASSVFDICVFVLCPLSIFKRTRSLAGLGFLLSSLVFGAALFGLSCTIVFNIWGYTGLILGLLLGIMGVVPVAFVAALSHAASVTFWPLPVGLVLTLGIRIFDPSFKSK